MRQVIYSTKAKKDLKRYRNKLSEISKPYQVSNMLINNVELPETFNPHKLTGQYAGCMECHVGKDFLLIWIDEEMDTI